MKLEDYRYIYFLGIGGIGMSAIARWFRARNLPVWGYDKTRTPLTEALEQEGIQVHYEDNVNLLPAEILADKAATLVVLTPAIPADHTEWAYLKEQGYTIRKRSEVLGIITASAYTVAVAGTHGKTTTSSIVAHLLHEGGVDCSAFLGGIATNLNSNLLIGNGTAEQETIVVEADEFDRSFLTLHPDIAIVTSADPDHLDIYGDKDELTRTFQRFIGQVKPGGYLILHSSLRDNLLQDLQPGVRVIRYGVKEGEAHVQQLDIQGYTFHFDVETTFGNIARLQLGLPGYHNVENAVAALVAGQVLGVPGDRLRTALASFRGVKRRFEIVHEGQDKVYIDDYAHHPKEIDAFLASLRAIYPNRKLTVLFQPHLYSRTRDFAAEFARSLQATDELILLDIYPAREKPIAGITSSMLLDLVNGPEKKLMQKGEVLAYLAENADFQVLATVGAGDIDTLVKPIKKILENN